jgi:esterase/lipase
VLDWMNEHYIQTIDIFGYSMGGYVALWLARFYPERVGKIFTLGTKLKWNDEEAEREIKMLNPEKVTEKVPAFALELEVRHGEHEWKSVMTRTALLMKDLAHTHLTEQDFLKIDKQILLGRGSEDTMVTSEETDYVHHLVKNSEYKTYEGVPHPIAKVPVTLLEKEFERFYG